jgi:hypothetical protein
MENPELPAAKRKQSRLAQDKSLPERVSRRDNRTTTKQLGSWLPCGGDVMLWLEGPSGIVLAVVIALALLYALAHLIRWHFRIAVRLRLLELKDAELAEQLASLRSARSLHEELSGLLAKTVSTRLDSLGAEDLAALDQVLRQRLPEMIGPVLQNASPRFSTAFAAAVEEQALAHLPAAITAAGPQLTAALQQRLQSTLDESDSDVWEPIDAGLTRHLVALAENLPAETAARIDEKALANLVSRAEEILESPEDFTELFERFDADLQEHILAAIEELPEECVQAIDRLSTSRLNSRVEEIFDNPGDHEDLFTKIDEKLGQGILELAEDPPDELAQKLDDRIGFCLLAELDQIYENPDDHESLYESLDEKLGERLLELAGEPPEETARKLDERLCASLLAELDQICDNTGDHEALFESLDEKLSGRFLELADSPSPELEQRLGQRALAGVLAAVDRFFEDRDGHEDFFSELDDKLAQRIRRRLREELHGERVESAIDETLRAHAQSRLQAADLTEVDRVLDQRLETLTANAPELVARIDEWLREELAARAANRRDQDNPAAAEATAQRPPGPQSFSQCVEEWVGAALEHARPALKNALESWLSHQAAEPPRAGEESTRGS